MRRILLPLTAFAVMLPVSFAEPVTMDPASAHVRKYRHYHYRGKVIRCRRSPGNAGLLAGGVAGGVVGSQVIGGASGRRRSRRCWWRACRPRDRPLDDRQAPRLPPLTAAAPRARWPQTALA